MSVNSLLWGIAILLLANMVLSGTVLAHVRRIARNQRRENMKLEELKAKVDAETSVLASAVTLISGLSQQLKDALANGADPDAIQAIADELDANIKPLADAVAANTPAAPAPADGQSGEQAQQ